MARRINTKFLGITAAVVGVLAGGGYVAQKYLVKENAGRYIESGKMFMAERRFKDAATSFGKASSLEPNDAQLRFNFGEAVFYSAPNDPENIDRAVKIWQDVLLIDPNHLPSMKRLVFAYQQVLAVKATAEIYRQVQDLSQRILKVDPNDLMAQTTIHSSVIQAAVAGLAVDAARVDEAVKGLEELGKKQPENALLPKLVAAAKINRAKEYQRLGRTNEAAQLVDEASKAFDESIKSQPRNAGLHFVAAQTLLNDLAGMSDIPSVAQGYLDKGREFMDQAKALIQPTDDQYSEVLRVWANVTVQKGNTAEAEKVMRDLLEQRPNDLAVRLSLASILSKDATRLGEAIDLLSTPAPNDNSVSAAQRRHQEISMKYELVSARLSLYGLLASRDATAAAKLREQIRADYDALAKELTNDGRYSYALLRLRGRVELAERRTLDAIATFNRALSDPANAGGVRDVEILQYQSSAYEETNQFGEAIKLLQEILNNRQLTKPGQISIRKRLVRLLAAERRIADAKPYVRDLEKLAPEDVEVQSMKIMLLDPIRDKDKVKQIYDGFPENTRIERMNKAIISNSIGNVEESKRLLNLILKEDPADLGAVVSMVRFLKREKKDDEAIKLVKDAIAKKPDDLPLAKVLNNLLKGADPEASDESEQNIQEIISKLEPFEREMALAQEAQSKGKIEEMLTHLQAADKLKPEDKRPKESLLAIYLGQKKWTEAEAIVKSLSAMNADQAKGQLYQFRLAMARGQTREAMTIAQSLRREYSEYSNTWVSLGQAYQAQGQFDEAISSYMTAIEKQNRNMDAYRLIISCNYLLRRPEEALKYIQTARGIFPQDVSLSELEITHDLQYGDGSKAVELRKRQLEANLENPNAYINLARAQYRAAGKKTESGNPAGAKELINAAIKSLVDARVKWPADINLAGTLMPLYIQQGAGEEAVKVAKALGEQKEWKGKIDPLMVLAEVYFRTGKTGESERTLREALSIDRDNLAVQMKLVDLLVATGKVEEGLRILQGLESHPEARIKRFDVLIGSGRSAEAEPQLLAAVQKNPNDVSLALLLAELYRVTGRYPEAKKTLADVLAKDSDNLMGLYKTGQVNLQMPTPNVEEAMNALKRITSIDPDRLAPNFLSDVRVLMSQCLLATGDVEGGIRELENAVQSNGDNRMARVRLIDLYAGARPPRWTDTERAIRQARALPQLANDPEILQKESQMWLIRGDGKKALDAVALAVKSAPNNEALLRYYLAVLLQTKNYQQAINETNTLLKNNPKVWWLYDVRGTAYARAGDKTNAVNELLTGLNVASELGNDEISLQLVSTLASQVGVDEALKVVLPKSESEPRWKLIAAMLYQAKNDHDSAVRSADAAISGLDKVPANQLPPLLRMAGGIYISSKPSPRVDSARTVYTRLLELTPDDVGALNNLACLYSEMQTPANPKQALVYSKRAFDLLQRAGRFEPLIYDTHGWALVQSGQVQEGIDVLEQVAARKAFPESTYHLAEAYLLRGFPEEAQRQLSALSEQLKALAEKKQPVDPILRAKIDDALSRATKKVQDAKSQAANP